TDAREQARASGAEDLVPERFAQIDELIAESQRKYESGDYEGAMKDSKEASDRYHVLQTLAEAKAMQIEADEHNFFEKDLENYMLAAETGNNAVDIYDEGNIAEAQAKADETLKRFNEVVKNGWVSIAEEKASDARDWETASQDIKANVAAKAEFDAAEEALNQAHIALRDGNYTLASELFEQSRELFNVAHNTALEKRRRAEEAMREAEHMLAESEEKAHFAEDLIGGGE
ncbi:MAG: hypothetical protein LBH07_03415, partial [Treponema sp.]|nr:hypothetical protein [Treponema sp.]